jgi:hypothetical protein
MTEKNPNLDSTAPDTATMADGVDYDRREARSGVIAIVSVTTMVVLLGMIVGVYWLYVVAYEKVDQEVYSGVSSKELQAIHGREEENLHRYGFINKEKGIVRIPIDRAMEIVASEYAQGKVSYNTVTYAAKQELPGGAAGGANPPAPAASAPGAPGAAPVAATTSAPAAAPAKPAGH